MCRNTWPKVVLEIPRLKMNVIFPLRYFPTSCVCCHWQHAGISDRNQWLDSYFFLSQLVPFPSIHSVQTEAHTRRILCESCASVHMANVIREHFVGNMR